MLKRWLLFFLSLIITLNLNSASFSVYGSASKATPKNVGSSLTNLSNQLAENLKKQEELKRKISDAQNQESTLASQIIYIENQIALRELEIEETETRIAQLKEDIGVLSGKLKNVEQDLNYLTSVSNERLRTIYMESYKQPLDVFIGSSANFNDLIVKARYAQDVRAQDVALLLELKDTKANYTKQKQELENKKAEEEGLKQKLASQRSDLDYQKGGKQNLLSATKNDEQTYQNLLAQTQAEQAALERLISSFGVKIGPVKRGDVVAFQGNTGCSSGSHLHFALIVGGSPIDPLPKLNSGSLRWPLDPPVTITQGFYGTFLNYGGVHGALDIVKSYGAPVKAAESGTAYRDTFGGCWRQNSTGNLRFGAKPGSGWSYTGDANAVTIDHPNGWRTLYLHVK